MALTNIKSLGLLNGSLCVPGPGQALHGMSGWRIYPMKMGCMVRTDTTTTDVETSGLGEFNANDYVMACTPVYFGADRFFVPDPSRISRIVAVEVDGDDKISLTEAMTLSSGDWLMNLADDTGANPLVSPNFDGAGIEIFSDPSGQISLGAVYVQTAAGGRYRGWLESGTQMVDLLVADQLGRARLLEPCITVGLEVV
jgi:hypothetical protein